MKRRKADAVRKELRGSLGHGTMDWSEIGRALGLSRESVRLIALGAIAKVLQIAPVLGEIFAAQMRVLDARSPLAELASMESTP